MSDLAGKIIMGCLLALGTWAIAMTLNWVDEMKKEKDDER